MKFVLSSLLLFFTFTISAGENLSFQNQVKMETSASSKFDRKKDRRKKRINKKRKRACNKWASRSFAG